MSLHADELPIDSDLVRTLLREQQPDLAGLAIREVRSTGTVNAIFRLGAELCVRLPRTTRWAADLEREWTWLPRLAGQVSLQVPEPVRLGAPSPAYPVPWAVVRWIDGAPYADGRVDDEVAAAHELAGFVAELGRIDPAGAPPAGRRPLTELDEETRTAIAAGAAEIDVGGALAAWDRALAAPPWDGRRVWIHSDLLRPNVLVRDGRLTAVIDFGGAGAGDPAMDVIAAWSVFGPAGRAAFRARSAVDVGTWERARGVALHQAAVIIPYYRVTNPDFAMLARRTVAQVLADLAA